jgi:glucose/arabinose dehydrogenase
MALAVSKRGELVVGESGSLDKPHAGAVSFYNPQDKGKLLLSVPTGLNEIVGLAYSPQSGNLYALDLSRNDAKEAGLYRIDAARQDGRMAAKAIKIVELDKPTALVFTSDGTLYVTLLGAAEAGAKEKTGQLVKIIGEL